MFLIFAKRTVTQSLIRTFIALYTCIYRTSLHLQTVVYSHPAQIARDSFEQEFWLCAFSLSRALDRGSVLPGGGETEEHCAGDLLKKAGKTRC